jgi:hypothetical protein
MGSRSDAEVLLATSGEPEIFGVVYRRRGTAPTRTLRTGGTRRARLAASYVLKVRRRQRQDGAWSRTNEAAYSLIEWDDGTGDAQVREYDARDELFRSFTWQLTVDEEPTAVLIEYDPEGNELRRERMRGPSRGW